MDSKLEILLVEDDVEVCEKISNQILDSEDMVLVGVTNNAYKAVQEIMFKLPDAVILDLELHAGSGNGISVLQELRNLSLPKRPYILITTNNSSRTTYEMAHSLGADFIMSKHQQGYSVESVLDFLRITKSVVKHTNKLDTLENRTNETEEQHTRRINRRISVELNRIGINPKSVGYSYLVDAIIIMLKNPTHNICTQLAIKNKKTESSVERAMQNAISRAWRTNSAEDLLAWYTAKIDVNRGNPTVTEFICYYANKLRNEY